MLQVLSFLLPLSPKNRVRDTKSSRDRWQRFFCRMHTGDVVSFTPNQFYVFVYICIFMQHRNILLQFQNQLSRSIYQLTDQGLSFLCLKSTVSWASQIMNGYTAIIVTIGFIPEWNVPYSLPKAVTKGLVIELVKSIIRNVLWHLCYECEVMNHSKTVKRECWFRGTQHVMALTFI